MREKPPAPSPRYIEALEWASRLHLGQYRKGKKVPYISHLIAVSALVLEDDGDEEQAIAALLHDAIEDAEVSADRSPNGSASGLRGSWWIAPTPPARHERERESSRGWCGNGATWTTCRRWSWTRCG